MLKKYAHRLKPVLPSASAGIVSPVGSRARAPGAAGGSRPSGFVRACVVMRAALACGPAVLGDAPFYSAGSVVNSADSQTGPLASNTIGTVYGKGLSYVTRTLTADDVRGGVLPTVLPGTGVTVLIGGAPANIFYVSPTQINFLVPSTLRPGRTDFQVVMNGISGAVVPLDMATSSPAMFQMDAQTVIATRLDGSLVTG